MKLLTIIFLTMATMVMATEQVSYTVIEKEGNKEIRQYDSYITATVSFSSQLEYSRQAFRILFRYISGNNHTSEQVDMTAPVFMDQPGQRIDMTAPVFSNSSPGLYSMSFVLPAKFTMKTAPIPRDNRVVIKEIAPTMKAAITFSGYMSDNSARSHQTKLLSWLANKDNYQVTSEPVRAGYDAPRVLPQNRRNEILVNIEYQ